MRKATVPHVESACRQIEETVAAWRRVVSRYESGNLVDAPALVEQEQLAQRLDSLANDLWDALETEAVHVLVQSDALCRWVQGASPGGIRTQPHAPTALDALEHAVTQLRAGHCVRRRHVDRAG